MSTINSTYSNMAVGSGGGITRPLQPCFLVHLAGDVTNVTGDFTEYVVAFDTEIFDIGSNFNVATYQFTAPVTGSYFFCYAIFIGGITTQTNGRFSIITNNGTYESDFEPTAIQTVNNTWSCTNSVSCDMTAGHTAHISLRIWNPNSKTIDIYGALTGTRFGGYLAC